MRLCFVGSSRANAFMGELLEVVATECAAAGVVVEHACDAFPAGADDLAYVVIPHEFFDTVAQEAWPSQAQLARTVALCVEQPGTPWFEISFEHARRCGAVMDISPVGIAELRRRGVVAERFALGWCEAWDGGEDLLERERPVEVLYMGSANRRRELLLSSYAGLLWRREHRLLVPPHTPKLVERPDFLLGERKRELLGSAQIVLNVRRQAPPYFEWVRALEAICCGAVLVTEHGAGHAPLVPGEHFVSGSAESLAALADGLLREPERLAAMRRAAYDLVRSSLPMRPAAERLAALAASLSPPLENNESHLVPAAREVDLSDPVLEQDRPIFDHGQALGAAVKRLALESIEARRERARKAVQAAGRDPAAVEVVHRSPAAGSSGARVTVCVPLYNHAGHVAATLDSVAAGELREVEVLVLDDASTDGGAEVVQAWSRERPWLALTLLGREVNAGLPHARNELARRAETEFVLMLDSDNELLPPCLPRLLTALDGDPGAFLAYPTLAIHREGRGDGLLSSLPWEPALLRDYNPIDALALLRRTELLNLGGYTTDPELHGWEDYDLWCRAAATGRRGVHVPMLLARYRRDEGSMLSITDLDQTTPRRALMRRYPQLWA